MSEEFEYGPALEERPFPDNPLYVVREDGAIRRVGSPVFRRPQTAKRGGYLVLGLWANNKERVYPVHVVVALTYHGPRPLGYDAAHEDGNKLNCHRDNIRWKTRQQNEADKVRHGTSNRGDRNGMATLNPEQVRAIRSDERVQSIIAREYGINQSTVSYIKTGRLWAHL